MNLGLIEQRAALIDEWAGHPPLIVEYPEDSPPVDSSLKTKLEYGARYAAAAEYGIGCEMKHICCWSNIHNDPAVTYVFHAITNAEAFEDASERWDPDYESID